MAHAENETTINRSPEDVYAFLADGLNNPAWRSGVQDITLKSGKPGDLGAVYSQTLTGPGGRPIVGDYEITAAEPGRHLVASRSWPALPARPVLTGSVKRLAERPFGSPWICSPRDS